MQSPEDVAAQSAYFLKEFISVLSEMKSQGMSARAASELFVVAVQMVAETDERGPVVSVTASVRRGPA